MTSIKIIAVDIYYNVFNDKKHFEKNGKEAFYQLCWTEGKALDIVLREIHSFWNGFLSYSLSLKISTIPDCFFYSKNAMVEKKTVIHDQSECLEAQAQYAIIIWNENKILWYKTGRFLCDVVFLCTDYKSCWYLSQIILNVHPFSPIFFTNMLFITGIPI